MPEHGLVEVQLELVTQVRATEYLGTTSAAAPSAKDVTEDIPENVAERIARAGTPAASARSSLHARVAVLIVSGPLLRVREDLAGLLRFLEELLRLLIVRIAVGVILHREAAIGLLDLRLGSGLGYVEYLVVVAFGHASVKISGASHLIARAAHNFHGGPRETRAVHE
jgi:hypothetical protein